MKHETRVVGRQSPGISEPDLTLLERPIRSDPRLHATRPPAQGGGRRLARACIGERGASTSLLGVPMVFQVGKNVWGACVWLNG